MVSGETEKSLLALNTSGDLLRLGKLMELFSCLQKSVEFSCMLFHVEFVFYCIFAKELLGNMSTVDTISVYIYFLVSFVIQRNF